MPTVGGKPNDEFLTLLQMTKDFVRIIIGKVNKVSCSATPPTLPRKIITCPTRARIPSGGIDFFPSRCVFPESKKKTLPLFSAKIETKFGRSSTETKKSPTPKLFFATRYRWSGLELEIGLRLGLKGLSDFN